jgi:hypothetical protein
MRELPFDLHFRVGDTPVHLVHGSPRKVNEYLCEDKPASLYERLAAAENDDALAVGHTQALDTRIRRRPVRQLRLGRQAKDGDPRGAFAVLSPTTSGVHARIERAGYDAESVATQVRDAGLPSEFAEKLLVAA